MNNFVLELIGRYFLTGLILWGALFIMLVARLAYIAIKKDGGESVFKFGEDAEQHPKLSPAGKFVRLIAWPYWIPMVIHLYMKEERKILNKMN